MLRSHGCANPTGEETTMQQICDDLEAQHEALDAVVADIDEATWRTPTPAEGWDVADTIAHISYFDDTAHFAVVDPEGFQHRLASIVSDGVGLASLAAVPGAQLLTQWRAARAALLDVMRGLDPKARIVWFGPSMSAISFATARLMEAWSHGGDVASALGRPMPETDRIRHIAHLGVVTRGWSYVNRGMTPPDAQVRVELVAPSGASWAWGPEDAADSIRGNAVDFCRVVAQRCSVADVALEVRGPAASEWMSIAQAFAGPPTLVNR